MWIVLLLAFLCTLLLPTRLLEHEEDIGIETRDLDRLGVEHLETLFRVILSALKVRHRDLSLFSRKMNSEKESIGIEGRWAGNEIADQLQRLESL